MQVNFEDQDYALDLEELDLAQARVIKRQTGLTLRGLQVGLSDLDPDALVCLYWLMMAQNGKAVDINKVNFKVAAFNNAIADAYERQEAGELGVTVEELRALAAEAAAADVSIEELARSKGIGANPTGDAEGQQPKT